MSFDFLKKLAQEAGGGGAPDKKVGAPPPRPAPFAPGAGGAPQQAASIADGLYGEGPTPAAMKQILDDTMRSSSDLEAFTLDYHDGAHRENSSGQDRGQQIDNLLAHASPAQIMKNLPEEASLISNTMPGTGGVQIPGGPTPEAMREIIMETHRSASDQEAFGVDYFGDAQKQATSNMDRPAQADLLSKPHGTGMVLHRLLQAEAEGGEAVKGLIKEPTADLVIPDMSPGQDPHAGAIMQGPMSQPTPKAMREMLDESCRGSADLEAFACDYFGDVHKQPGFQGANRTGQVNQLVQQRGTGQMLSRLLQDKGDDLKMIKVVGEDYDVKKEDGRR